MLKIIMGEVFGPLVKEAEFLPSNLVRSISIRPPSLPAHIHISGGCSSLFLKPGQPPRWLNFQTEDSPSDWDIHIVIIWISCAKGAQMPRVLYNTRNLQIIVIIMGRAIPKHVSSKLNCVGKEIDFELFHFNAAYSFRSNWQPPLKVLWPGGIKTLT